jgi:hypothetical protein
MKLIMIAIITAGLATPAAVIEKSRVEDRKEAKTVKKTKSNGKLKRAGNKLLSAVLFLAEPAK